MLRSLYAGVSGLRANQTDLDVTANNIANSSTIGFKRSGVVFQDLLSQLVRGATGNGAATNAGQNPAQVGLGVKVASITMNMEQGSLQQTGKATDVAVQGDGMFVVSRNGETMYSRAGTFGVDELGILNTPDGGKVQGWMADAGGNVNSAAPVTDLVIQVGQQINAKSTDTVQVGRNLDSTASVGTTVTVTSFVYDTLGETVPMTLTFTKAAGNSWTLAADSNGTALTLSSPTVTFDGTGTLTSGNIDITGGWPTALIPGNITLDFGNAASPGRLTGMATSSTAVAISQDGYGPGTLLSFSIGSDGTVNGAFSNGRIATLAQLAMANFANPAGLEKVGSTMYRPTPNSGLAQVGTAGTGGRGLLVAGALEQSNVDLGTEFTQLILSQRGVQANSKVLSASDEVLQEVLNIRR